MVFKSAADRAVTVTALLVLIAGMWLCPAVMAQATVPPVVTSSAVAMDHPDWYNVSETVKVPAQFYRVILSSKGDILLYDGENSQLYQFPADGTAVKTLVGPPPNSLADSLERYSMGGIFLDSNDTLYICYRWNDYILRIPYDPVTKSWSVSTAAANHWAADSGVVGHNWISPIDLTQDGDGNFYISDELYKTIYKYNEGGSGTPIILGLLEDAFNITSDRAGNIYFTEHVDNEDHAVGVFRIPASLIKDIIADPSKVITADGTGSTERGWPPCVPGLAPDQQVPCRADNGLKATRAVSLDARGNIYVVDNDPAENLLAMIPNENGMPNPAHQTILAPISSVGSVAVDPRGFLYAPVLDRSRGGFDGIYDVAKIYLGSAALTAAAAKTQGASSFVYYAFNSTLTPQSFTLTQGSHPVTDFALTDTGGSGSCIPTLGPRAFNAKQGCKIQVALNSQVVGPADGLLTMDASGSPVAKTYVHGTGLGRALAALIPAVQNPIRSSLASARQVAIDRSGNIYVADSSAGKILQYPAGATDDTQPVEVGEGFVAPAGVGVDGDGNVFVADNGTIVKVPYVNGALSAAGQAVVQAGLGTNLSIAVGGTGSVYVADPDNKRVVKVPNPDTKLITAAITTVGAGFDSPSAVTVDDAGNIFVVDGANLVEILISGDQLTLTSELISPTGVAIDASGSLYVAQAGGVIRIPVISGALDYTKKMSIGLSIGNPVAVALDSTGNVYISDGDTAGFVIFSINAAVQFGYVHQEQNASDTVTLFSIGNQDLHLSSPMFTPLVSAEFTLSDNSCDGATLAPGTTCSLTAVMTPGDTLGVRTETKAIDSDADNALSISLTLTGESTPPALPSVTTATYTPQEPAYPNDLTVSVTVAPESGEGMPTGNVVLTVDGQNVAPKALVDSAVQFVLVKPNGGHHTIVAKYLADSTYGSSFTTLEIDIALAATTTVVTPTDRYVRIDAGEQLEVLVTSPAGLPTGIVSFTEGEHEWTDSLTGDGHASFNASSLPLGVHTISVRYQGDSNFTGSDGGSVTFQVINPSVLFSARDSALTTQAGVPVGTVLSVQSLKTYNGGVNLSCQNLPQYSECTFSWPTLTVNSGETRLVELEISTNVPVNVLPQAASLQPVGVWWSVGPLAAGLFGMFFGKKTRYNSRLLTVICAVLIISSVMAGMSACSGGSYVKIPDAPHVTTPPGTQNVSIVATDTTTQQTVSLPFTIPVTIQQQ